jgi:hypothetical protein
MCIPLLPHSCFQPTYFYWRDQHMNKHVPHYQPQ